MAEPSRNDISAIFKRLRSVPTNKVCFDCSAKNPSWASITYGVFLCIDCSGTHRSLGVHLSFIRSTELDFNWSWFQLRCMQVGGNASAISFFNEHGCRANAANTKYNSRAAQLYREKIKTLATQATRRHGTELWLDSQSPLTPTSPDDKQVDFFALHTQEMKLINSECYYLTGDIDCTKGEPEDLNMAQMTLASSLEKLSSSEKEGNKNGNPEDGPSLELLSVSPKGNSEPSSFLKKKPTGAKKTLGSKKGGLGAQKVSNQSFSEFEKKAQAADKLRQKEENTTKKSNQSDDSIGPSLRLAYKDLEQQRKLEEQKLKCFEGKKKEQAERLGMGLGMRSGVSHSVTSDMHVIQQETPTSNKTSKARRFTDEEDDEGSFTSRVSSHFEDQIESDKFSPGWGDGEERDWMKESKKPEPDFFLSSTMSSLNDKPTARRKPEAVVFSDTGEARKKFGSDVKAISSDMYFGKQDNSEYDTRTQLERFSGSTAISSADLFDDPKKKPTSSYRLANALPSAPDMSQLKHGVRSVAGKLSVMASGVVSSIQDHYST